MIFIGFIHFNEVPDIQHKLRSTLASYTQTSPRIVQKNSVVVSYGKLSDMQDQDALWGNASSFLLGRVFDKKESRPFREADFQSFSDLNTEEMVQKIWGKYVYIAGNEKASQFQVILDSTGQLPFFYYPFPNGNVLFASDIEILFKFLSQKPEYNWTYLCSYLVYGNSSTIQTAFKNIYELPPGCRLHISKNERKTQPFWNPLQASQANTLQEKDAVGVLQEILKPWVEPYKNICVSLSGGLDSSSLVYCLQGVVQEHQKLMALNYFHSQIQSSNELAHARRVCQETGISLIEVDVADCLPFDCPQRVLPLSPNKPFPGLISLKWFQKITDQLPLNDSSAFLSGHGSDHIFMCPPSKKSLSDYIIEQGFKGSKGPLQDLATFYRDTLPSLLKENIVALNAYLFSRRPCKRHSQKIQKEHPHWITQELLQKVSSDFVHPLYDALPAKIRPGKYDQIDAFYEGVASIQLETNPFLPTFYPFLYEPVVDFALSFPTYDLFKKGYDRYPLRKATYNHFKTETVWRRDKSQTTGILQLGIKKNLESVLHSCVDGQLAKLGLIDKAGLQETIKRISNGDITHLWPFIHLASIETFLAFWEAKFIS